MLTTLQIRLIGALAIAALIGYAGLRIYQKGKAEGYKQGTADQLKVDQQSFTKRNEELRSTLGQAQKDIAQGDAKLRALQEEFKRLQRQRSITVPAPVRPVPDKPLWTDLPIILTPAPIVEEVPSAATLEDVLEAQVLNLQEQVEVILQRESVVVRERDILLINYNNLVENYIKAYNASQKKHSLFIKIITLGIVRDRHISIPDPISLQRF